MPGDDLLHQRLQAGKLGSLTLQHGNAEAGCQSGKKEEKQIDDPHNEAVNKSKSVDTMSRFSNAKAFTVPVANTAFQSLLTILQFGG